ncbi:hypothetical protein RQP46_001540 [Phenoliferia psychrophenolica]
MHFSPALRTTTTLSLTPSSSSPTLHFTCQDPPAQPEVWTNVASPLEVGWRAVAFVQSSSTDSGFWTAELALTHLGDGTHEFEYTYRIARSDGAVEWLGQEGGNGKIVVRVGAQTKVDLEDVKVRLVEFDLKNDAASEGTELFSLYDVAEIRDFVDSGPSQGFVLEQSERPWFIPRLLPSPTPLASLSPDFISQLVLLRSESSSRTLVLYPFSNPLVASSLVGSSSTKGVSLHCARDSTSPSAKGSLVVGVAKDGQLRALIDQCVETARESLGGSLSGIEEEAGPVGLTWCTWNALGPDYSLSKVLDSLKKFGLPASLSTDTPLFTRAIDAVLLDDGWQDVQTFDDPFEPGRTRRGLWSFGANGSWADVADSSASEGEGEAAETSGTVEGRRRRRQDSGFYPEADRAREMDESKEELKDAVKRIKELGIENVGCWMTLAGYWDSIHPSGPIASSYPLHCLTVKSDVLPSADTTFFLPGPASLKDYYTDYFTFLRDAGITYVKVDDQAHLDFIASSPSSKVDVGALRQTMLSAMQEAALDVFASSRVVHCMAGSVRVFGGPLALTSEKLSVVRNSDDYFPDRPDSHRYHIFLNAHTSLLTRSLAFLPDFDMCQEQHPWGPFHIAFRAFSPAPTFATDAPGEVGFVDPRGWKMMLAPSALGGVRVLKTERETGAVLEGRIGEDVVGGSTGPAIKIGMSVPGAGGAILGLWNCRADENSTQDVLDARDVGEALASGATSDVVGKKDVLVYFGGREKAYEVSGADLSEARGSLRIAAKPVASISLAPREAQVATIAPFHTLPPLSDSNAVTSTTTFDPVKIACVGLIDKYAGLCAVTSIGIVDRAAPLPLTTTPQASTPSTSSTLSRKSSTISLRESFAKGGHGRFSFLLACLFGYRRATSDGDDGRTFRGEASSLAHDLLRRPFRTIFSEFSAVAGLLTAAAVWTVSIFHARRTSAPPSIAPSISSRQASIAEEPVVESRKKDESGKVLRVQLAFAGAVGFYTATPRDVALSFTLGGKRIGSEFVRTLEGSGIVAVDVEAFLGEKVHAGAKDGWVLDVGC